MHRFATAALMLALALLGHSAAVAVELTAGAVLRAPSGAEYVLGEELPYSPRLMAVQRRARAEQAATNDHGASLLQVNGKSKTRQQQRRQSASASASGPDDYTVGAKIGQGGFGAIFKATRKHGVVPGGSQTGPTEVAIKVQHAATAHELAALQAEYDVQHKLMRLCPAHVVTLFEHWEQRVPATTAAAATAGNAGAGSSGNAGGSSSGGGFRFVMAMELMSGDLDHYVHAHTTKTSQATTTATSASTAVSAPARGDVPWTLGLWRQMVEGVACLHAHGYVHRDIKGGNFLVASAAAAPAGSKGDAAAVVVKVSDFGETRNAAQLRSAAAERPPRAPYPHQTILFNAPSAVVLGAAGTTRWSFVAPAERTWTKRLSWDGYALGLTMLGVYYGTDVVELARRSTAPAFDTANGTPSAYLQLFSTAFRDDTTFGAFVHGLDAVFNLPAVMPDALQGVVKGLVREQRAVTGVAADTASGTVAPFVRDTTWSLRALPPPAASSAPGPLSATVAALVAPPPATPATWTPRFEWISASSSTPAAPSASAMASASGAATPRQ